MIKMSILFALLGSNPAIQHNTFIAHINQTYRSHKECWQDLSRVVVNIINEELEKTGKSNDWKVALCIDYDTMEMTYKFSETMQQEIDRKQNEKKGTSI